MLPFLQVPTPASGTEAWPWVAALIASALGFVYFKYQSSQEARIKRYEEREDAVIADNRAQASVLKDQSTAILHSVQIAETALELAKQTNDKLDRILWIMEQERPSPPKPRTRTQG